MNVVAITTIMVYPSFSTSDSRHCSNAFKGESLAKTPRASPSPRPQGRVPRQDPKRRAARQHKP
eukprot:10953451-Alexandrium_andersonii.AAC.1